MDQTRARKTRLMATGQAAMCLMGLGIVALFPGVITMGVAFGDSTWADEFFNGMRIAAIALVTIGLFLVATASVLFCISCKSAKKLDQSLVRQHISGGPVVTGYTPPHYNISHQQYPPPIGQYESPQGQFQPSRGQYDAPPSYFTSPHLSNQPQPGVMGEAPQALNPGFLEPYTPPSYIEATKYIAVKM